MKVCCIGDLQGQAQKIKPDLLPEADMLLIAGDIANNGTIKELEETNEWLDTLPYKYKIVVAGNHDQEIRDIDGHQLFTNAIYLQDELVEIEGFKIYGTPANEMNELRFNYDWAFCDPEYLRKVAKDIPEGLDILLTHGVCYGIQDQLWYNHQSVGSRDMLDAVTEKKPHYFVAGHIHEGHGIEKHGDTTFINAATCDPNNILLRKDGSLFYEPIVIEL